MPDDGLGREIGQLREDFRAGLAEIKLSLAGLMPREVHTVLHEALVQRVAALERELEVLDAKHAAAIKDLRDEFEEAEEKRAGRRRWLIGGPILGLVTLIVTIWLGLRSKSLPILATGLGRVAAGIG